MSGNNSPWGSGGGSNGGGKNPWGSSGGGNRGGRGGGSGGGNKPPTPDLDNVIKGFKTAFGGKGGGGKRGGSTASRFGPFGMFFLLALIALLMSSVFTVKQQEEAVILRFGKYSRTVENGLHFKFPAPIETKHKINVTTQRSIGSQQNLVLTGDENIADIDFTVRWNIKNAEDYLFNLENPDDVVADAADSALREVIGKKTLESVITTERQPIEAEVKGLLQAMLDQYEVGVDVTVVQLQRAEAPPKVIKAYEDVVTAEQEKEQRVNEGLAHRNEVTENAVGESAKVVEAAEAYKAQVVSIANGEADRFNAVYKEYKAAPRVTRQRIYLETIEEIYKDADKIILDEKAGSGIVPYLPLDQLNKKTGGR